MNTSERIYLDNAATSWPKPKEVYEAVDNYQRNLGAPAGRGAYDIGVKVQRLVAECRATIAELIGAGDPQRIVFAFNGTDALNIALHGLLRPGDHVLTTVVEHNSVLRPLRWLQSNRGVHVTRVGCAADGYVDADSLVAAMRDNTRLIALTHASNVTGVCQPVEAAAQIAHQSGALLLVDAAQSLGHMPLDVGQSQIDLLAASGHKGLLGPLGTGLLYVAPGLEEKLESFRQGGTGTKSEEDAQPRTLPDMFEAGNLNVPGIVGLAAGADYVRRRTVSDIHRHEMSLTLRLVAELRAIDGVRVFAPDNPARTHVGVVSCTIEGFEPQELATLLDSTANIQVRAGLHCAPLVHQAIGSAASGGTVRLSVGPFTTDDDIDAAIEAMCAFSGSAP